MVSVIGLGVVSVFCVLAGIAYFNWAQSGVGRIDFFDTPMFKSSVDETMTLESKGVTEIEINLDYSDIQISEIEGDNIELHLVKTGWAYTEEEASQIANALFLSQDLSNGKATFSLSKELAGLTNDQAGKIDIQLIIPNGMKIEVNVKSGEILLSGIEVADINVDTQDGKITLQNVFSRGGCLINTDYAEIEVDTIRCSNLLVNSSGWESVFANGEIENQLEISSSFGRIELWDMNAASYSIDSLSADIFANNLKGDVSVKTGFGKVELYSQDDVTLFVESEYGDLYFEGTLSPNSDHTVKSDNGNIELFIPSESALDLYLSSFGEIQIDFLLSLTGQLSSRVKEGEINGGGPLLTIESDYGNISLNFINNKKE